MVIGEWLESPFEIVIGEWLKSRSLTSDWWVIGITIFRDRANTCWWLRLAPGPSPVSWGYPWGGVRGQQAVEAFYPGQEGLAPAGKVKHPFWWGICFLDLLEVGPVFPRSFSNSWIKVGWFWIEVDQWKLHKVVAERDGASGHRDWRSKIDLSLINIRSGNWDWYLLQVRGRRPIGLGNLDKTNSQKRLLGFPSYMNPSL